MVTIQILQLGLLRVTIFSNPLVFKNHNSTFTTCVTSLLKELLEPKERKESGAQGEVGGQGEDEQQNREVDVEGVGDDGHHVHVAHHPGVRCLLLPVVDHMRVLRTTNQSSWPHYKDHMPPH